MVLLLSVRTNGSSCSCQKLKLCQKLEELELKKPFCLFIFPSRICYSCKGISQQKFRNCYFLVLRQAGHLTLEVKSKYVRKKRQKHFTQSNYVFNTTSMSYFLMYVSKSFHISDIFGEKT